MNKAAAIKLFEQKQIRSLWDDEKEKWFFLHCGSKEEGSQLVTNSNQLKTQTSGIKDWKAEISDTDQLLRHIQSISPAKAFISKRINN